VSRPCDLIFEVHLPLFSSPVTRWCRYQFVSR
jgi:hypothetical protein